MAVTGFRAIDKNRQDQGFRSIAETFALAETNTILDPYSTLIATNAEIGSDNVFYPGVVVRVDGGVCRIGDINTFWPSTIILAAGGGRITIGNACAFGPGGARVIANHPDSDLRVGDRVRLLNGAEVLGSSHLGDGSQVLGAISAQGVELAGGDDFTGADPDLRGGVLKGFGLARRIQLAVGEVMSGAGDFLQAAIERQSGYH
jgi:hypothetical protein